MIVTHIKNKYISISSTTLALYQTEKGKKWNLIMVIEISKFGNDLLTFIYTYIIIKNCTFVFN